jgi:hypothetical protein
MLFLVYNSACGEILYIVVQSTILAKTNETSSMINNLIYSSNFFPPFLLTMLIKMSKKTYT